VTGRKPFSRLLLLIALVCLSAVSAFADSQARIVRLGEAQGDVRIDRNTGQGYEKAFLNLPITQGMKIRTGNDGRASLELEDGSTLRLTPDSVLDVPQLSLRDSGAKVSTFHLQEGMAYVNSLGAKDNEITVSFAHETIAVTQSAHLRVNMGDTGAAVAVFKGTVQIATPSGTVEVGKGKTADFDLINDSHKLTSEIEDNPFDSWDKQQAQYQQEYSSKSYASYSPYPYGTSDLNYYGSFFDAPGYGSVWQPYFAGAGWDPFMNGAWAFYPGFGYGWVSAYPWGWTPYHYGSWNFLPGYGWVWQPGGNWMGTTAVPVVPHAPLHFDGPQPPATQGLRLQAVNKGASITQIGKSSTHVQIPYNSAGLGIPRGSVTDLRDLSHTARQKGFATTTLHTGPTGLSSWLNSGYGGQQNGGFGGPRSSAGQASASGHTSGAHAAGGAHH
jgi:FecR protein